MYFPISAIRIELALRLLSKIKTLEREEIAAGGEILAYRHHVVVAGSRLGSGQEIALKINRNSLTLFLKSFQQPW